MRNTKYAVMITLLKVMVRHHKFWSIASQKKILDLLETYHGLKIHVRQLNYHLADLRGAGYIKTISRKHRNADGTLCLLTSAHCITIKGYKYLITKSVSEAWQRLKELKTKYIPKPEPVSAQEKPLLAQEITPKKTGKNPFLDPVFRKRKGMTPLTSFS